MVKEHVLTSWFPDPVEPLLFIEDDLFGLDAVPFWTAAVCDEVLSALFSRDLTEPFASLNVSANW